MTTKYLIHVEAPNPYKSIISQFLSNHSGNFEKINPLQGHLTLFIMQSIPELEDRIIDSIACTAKEPYYQHLSGVFLSSLDNFGSKFEENVLVSRFEQNGAVKLLHYELAHNLRKYIRKRLGPLPDEFENDQDRVDTYNIFGSPYFGKFYTPHTTLGTLKPGKTVELELDVLEGLGWRINEIILSRKSDGKWEKVRSFGLH